MATIKDVARQTGLSITTVSRALNNYDDVSEATRTRVRLAARDLDYHPSAVARSLQRSRTNAIGVAIPPVLHRCYDAFWLEFIGGVASVCAARGKDLVVSLATDEDCEDAQHSYQRLVRERRVDGILVCDVRCDDERIRYLQRQRLPFVAFGRTVERQDYAFVDIDSALGATQAVRQLVALGHRRIAYLGVDPSFGFSHYRYTGYHQALVEAGIPLDKALVYHALRETDVLDAATALLTRRDRPTAVFTAADFLALNVLTAARLCDLRVPDDLSVLTFDDNILVEHAQPPLTAIGQENRRIGEESAALLFDRIQTPDAPVVQRLLAPSLTIRASTAPPASP